jgi:hypothetical protein
VLSAGVTFALLGSIALAIFVDILGAVMFLGSFLLLGGLLSVFMGDLPLPDEYELPSDTLSDHMRDFYNSPP